MADNFDVNDSVRVWANIAQDGALIDPTALTLKYRKPDGTIVTKTYAAAQIVKESTGVYHYDILADASGEWGYGFVGTGTGAGAKEGDFHVRRSRFS